MQDLDLFFKDKGNFVHISSGGGMPPSALATDVAQNAMLSAAVLNMPGIYEVAVTNRLEKIKHLHKAALDRYLASYIQMARRGFFS